MLRSDPRQCPTQGTATPAARGVDLWEEAQKAVQRIHPARISRTTVKIASATGAALIAIAFVMPATGFASTDISVPCSGSGGGSAGLIAAINAANANGGGRINLVQGCTYLLNAANNTRTIPNAPAWSNGLPVITSKITIDGSGGDNEQQGQSESSGATIAGNGKDFGIFEVDGPGGNLTLHDLTITKGFTSFAGGGLFNIEGTVTLDHSRVTGSTGSFGGGGIASGVVDPNHLGPIGTLTLNFSQVDANTAVHGGGGGIVNHAGTLILNHSQVNHNTSRGGGGGIASGPGNGGTAGSSTLIVRFSQVNNNVSTGGPMAGAGGIANGGVATIAHSQVDGNSAPGAPGGGILNHGTMTIDHSQVNGNAAPKDTLGNDGSGGGILNFDVSAAFTGAPSASLTLIHSDVNNNSVSGLGGGILEVGVDSSFNFGAPGGPLMLDNSTVTGNSAASGGGIFASPGSLVTLDETRVFRNTPDNCAPPGIILGCIG
jgi:hypothetical protein